MTGCLSIVLLDDDAASRSTTRRWLCEHQELDVVAACGTLEEALTAVHWHRPAVVVADYSPVGGHSGLGAAIRRLRAVGPDCLIVVYSGKPGRFMRELALKAGADEVLEKSADRTQLRALVREAGLGQSSEVAR